MLAKRVGNGDISHFAVTMRSAEGEFADCIACYNEMRNVPISGKVWLCTAAGLIPRARPN